MDITTCIDVVIGVCMLVSVLVGYHRGFLVTIARIVAMVASYIGAVLASYGFFFDKKRVKQLMAVLFVMALMITIPICQNSKLYRGKKYHYYFEEMTNEMQKHYILADYKNIDLDALIDKYDPAFREAQKKNDGILYYESMIKSSRNGTI